MLSFIARSNRTTMSSSDYDDWYLHGTQDLPRVKGLSDVVAANRGPNRCFSKVTSDQPTPGQLPRKCESF